MVSERQGKTYRQLERYFKGVANHRRIAILLLVAQTGGIGLDQISKRLQCNMKTISEHTRRLVLAGLLQKFYRGRTVAHILTPYGKKMLACLKLFSHS